MDRQRSISTYPIPFLMVDSTDHVTGKTGLTPTVTVRKMGGSFGSASATVSEIANGWYLLSGSGLASDLDTLGTTIFHATGSGADPADFAINTVPWDPYDSIRSDARRVNGGVIPSTSTTGVLPVELRYILGTALTETSGQIAAAFKKFFNVSSPTGTVNSIPDAVAGQTNGLSIVGSAMTLTAANLIQALGFIHFDSTAGSDGDGTLGSPFNSWASVVTAIGNIGVDHVFINSGSTVTLSGNSDYYQLSGSGYSVALNGQSIDGIRIDGGTISGIGTAASTNGTDSDAPQFVNCKIKTVTLPPCFVKDSVFTESVFTFSTNGHYFFDGCSVHEIVGGSGGVDFDFTNCGAATMRMRCYGWNGGRAGLKNMDNSGGNIGVTFGGHSGIVWIKNTCTSCGLERRGTIAVTDEGTSSTLTTSSLGAFYDRQLTAAQVNSECDTALSDYAPAQAGDAMTLTSAEDVYHADICLTVDSSNSKDEWTVTWFKNGIRQTSGITSPTLQVVKRADGSDLIAASSMTQIGSTGSYKLDATTTSRTTAGESVLAVAAATINSSSRSFSRNISRDSEA